MKEGRYAVREGNTREMYVPGLRNALSTPFVKTQGYSAGVPVLGTRMKASVTGRSPRHGFERQLRDDNGDATQSKLHVLQLSFHTLKTWRAADPDDCGTARRVDQHSKNEVALVRDGKGGLERKGARVEKVRSTALVLYSQGMSTFCIGSHFIVFGQEPRSQ